MKLAKLPSLTKKKETTMGDGVMTTKEFGMETEQKKKSSEDKKDKPDSKTGEVEIRDIYELESANGKTGNCAFYDSKGDEQTLKLTNGRFTIPKIWNPVKRQQYREMLLDARFILKPTETVTVPKEVKKTIYTLMHPDHSENEPINGDFKINVSGKKVKLNVVNGIIETMDPKVKTQLKRKGFVEYTGEMGDELGERSKEDNFDPPETDKGNDQE